MIDNIQTKNKEKINMNTETKEKISKYALKPLLGGAINTLAANVMFGSVSGSGVPIMGTVIDANVVLFGTGFISKVGSELISDYALSHIPHNEKYLKIENAAIGAASGAAANYGILAGLGLIDMSDIVKPAILGAVNEVGTSYLYNTFLHDMYMNSSW